MQMFENQCGSGYGEVESPVVVAESKNWEFKYMFIEGECSE